jgi:hypothetical protein
MIVVSDSSPLNILARIGHATFLEAASTRNLLDLARAFERIRATDFSIAPAILAEALRRDAARRQT